MLNYPTDSQIDELKLDLTSLNEIVLYENRMTLIHDNQFLHTINLSNEALKIKPDLFNDLKNLKKLFIYKQQLEKIDSKMFNHLDELNVLHI